MTQRELAVLNSLVTYAAENIPGGLNSEEQQVARAVGQWHLDGLPVRGVCPHCCSVMPYGEARLSWFAAHIDNPFHRWVWRMRKFVAPRRRFW